MAQVYKFRVLIDTEEDIFRDIEIRDDQSFEDLHLAIIKAFGFFGDQMTSFYMSNDNWDKGLEIVLMDMGFDERNAPPQMKTAILKEFVEGQGQKIIYIYDFLRMWIFYLEVISISEIEAATEYPKIVLEYGQAPNENDKELSDDLAFLDALGSEAEAQDPSDEIGDMFEGLEDFDGSEDIWN